MHETKVLIEWLDEISEAAKVAGKSGDASKANALAKNASLRYYFNNVYMLGSVSRAEYATHPAYRQNMLEVDALYTADMTAREQVRKLAEAEEAHTAAAARITALEAQNADILAKLTALIEAQPAPKAKKPAKAEPVVEDESEVEAE